MSLTERHPSFIERQPDWGLMHDSYAGERTVKAAGDRYLPPTAGMVANGYGKVTPVGIANLGQAAYDAYRKRALYPDAVKKTITGLLGMVHRKPPVIEVPAALQPMVDRATIAGESIEVLWRRITEAQLLDGRCGLLVDIPSGRSIGEVVPYIALYGAPAISNWDAGIRAQGRQKLEVVVLDESAFERVELLRWEWVTRYRVLAMSEIVASFGADVQDAPAAGVYMVGTVRQSGTQGSLELAAAEFLAPQLGGMPLLEIPFVFVNTNDLVPEPCQPPLLGLAHLCMAIYRGEADYRQTLFMQGQDTLVRVGATEEQREMQTGAGAIIDLPMGGEAKFIGVSSSGLSEQRQALENDKAEADLHAVQALDAGDGKQAESGEALRVRVSARTATLASLQLTAAQALKDCLTLAGRWMGLSEAQLESIVVEPNLDFSDEKVDAATLNGLMDAKLKGLPLSLESIHSYLQRNEFTELSFEDEMQKISEEVTTVGMGGQSGTELDPTAPDGGAGAPPGGGDEDEDDDREQAAG
jgi:hypothetical protein